MKIIAQLNRSSRIQLGSSKRKSCKGLDLKKSDTSRINDLMTLLKGLEKKTRSQTKVRPMARNNQDQDRCQ